MSAYYNEIDPSAAQWLRNLMTDGLIPPGDVDERDIREVMPGDLEGYTQCHFFAGIGGWPLALQLAGWPDDRPVWTGSCPCQPFSAAGKRKGAADERHLWPAFHALIAELKPSVCFGEQVASPLGREWLAGVRADLEALGYAVGAADLCAAGVGAPHIRQRLFWVGDATGKGRDTKGQSGEALSKPKAQQRSTGPSVPFWQAFDVIPCGDGKARRIEPGTFPLVDGLPRGVVPGCDISPSYAQATAEGRVMRLRGYGNAIVPSCAAEFVRAFMDRET